MFSKLETDSKWPLTYHIIVSSGSGCCGTIMAMSRAFSGVFVFLLLLVAWPVEAGIILGPAQQVGDPATLNVCTNPARFSGDTVIPESGCRQVETVYQGGGLYVGADGATYQMVCDQGPVSYRGASQAAGLVLLPYEDEDGNPVACSFVMVGSPDYAVVVPEGLVPACPVGEPNCADPYSADNYGPCELVALVNNVVSFLIGIASVLAVITFVYAGYIMVLSQGNPSQIGKAKELFVNVLIGYVILLTAFLVVNTILSMMVGSTSSLLNWNQIECSYAYRAGVPTTEMEALGQETVSAMNFEGSVVVNRYEGTSTGGVDYGQGGSAGSTGGSCSVITNPQNYCYPGNLGCFGSRAEDASKICNIESAGGNARAVSGTDLCEDGASFSGGLFQINILAHYDKLPGCSNNFFMKNGDGTQGTCLDERNGYCAVRDCRITDPAVYDACMNATFNPDLNIDIACQLFDNRGGTFGDWAYSANKCGI